VPVDVETSHIFNESMKLTTEDVGAGQESAATNTAHYPTCAMTILEQFGLGVTLALETAGGVHEI
jgi:hypothetical protein